MSIVERSKVLSAYERAVALGSDHEEACAVVGNALAMGPEVVAQVVRDSEEELQQ